MNPSDWKICTEKLVYLNNENEKLQQDKNGSNYKINIAFNLEKQKEMHLLMRDHENKLSIKALINGESLSFDKGT